MRLLPFALLGLIAVASCGCASASPANPSFPITMDEAVTAWSVMRENPKPLARPVIVLGGIYDPGLAAHHVAGELKEIAGDDAPVLAIGFLEAGSFDRSAKKVIAAVHKKFPSDDPSTTVEVDVIGFSMGGVVARYAASDFYAFKSGTRLNVRRVFTVSSPHQGATLADIPSFDSRVINMREGSTFLKTLNAEQCEYELITYARLGDGVVGEENAAPPGHTAWWTSKHRGLSHASAYGDKRILGDIARRLRDEQPFTTEPPAPLPDS